MDVMSPKKTYVAIYERDAQDDAWNVHIDGLAGCQTYGRSLHRHAPAYEKLLPSGSTASQTTL